MRNAYYIDTLDEVDKQLLLEQLAENNRNIVESMRIPTYMLGNNTNKETTMNTDIISVDENDVVWITIDLNSPKLSKLPNAKLRDYMKTLKMTVKEVFPNNTVVVVPSDVQFDTIKMRKSTQTLDAIELSNCANDCKYFINNYVHITNPCYGKSPLALRDYQEDMVDLLTLPTNTIIKSCRQSGKTSLSLAYILWYALFHDDKLVVISALNLNIGREMMRMLRDMYERLPRFLQLPRISNNKHEMSFENGSKIVVATSDVKHFERNFSYHSRPISLCYFDEFAYVDESIQMELWHILKRHRERGMRFIMVSTPNTNGAGLFKSLWDSVDLWGSMIPLKRLHIDWKDVPGRTEEFKHKWEGIIGEDAWKIEYEAKF